MGRKGTTRNKGKRGTKEWKEEEIKGNKESTNTKETNGNGIRISKKGDGKNARESTKNNRATKIGK